MNYTAGIKKCKQALIKLSSKDDFAKRIDNAFGEVSEIDPHETSYGFLEEVVEWCEEYLSFRDKGVKSDGVLNEMENKKKLVKLSQKLTFLCLDIIEYNSKNHTN